jgi:hypothetical protein
MATGPFGGGGTGDFSGTVGFGLMFFTLSDILFLFLLLFLTESLFLESTTGLDGCACAFLFFLILFQRSPFFFYNFYNNFIYLIFNSKS